MQKDKLRLGIDLGGTEIKFGVFNFNNSMLYKTSVLTPDKVDEIINDISKTCNKILSQFDIGNMGIGIPGEVCNGVVDTDNLPFKNYPLDEELEKRTGRKFRIANDADCAALAEIRCGEGVGFENLVMITLGTGIGGGIVINKKIYQGRGVAGEIGHMCIQVGGRKCSCGRNGCWERYSSASALISTANEGIENKKGILYDLYIKNGKKMDGKIFFKALSERCELAIDVFNEYIYYTAIGIDNIISIFDPDMIVLSGGITNSNHQLLEPIKKAITYNTPIAVSKLKGDAGIVGASLL